MKILTTKSIGNMKPGLGEVSDGRVPGLSVFSGRRGPVSFGLRYRRPGSGRTAKITLGRINLGEPLDDLQRGDPLTLAQARAMALELHQQIERGIDPGRDHHRRDTFGEVMDRYFRERASVNRSGRHARQIIENDCGDWMNRPMRSITSRDVRDLVKRASNRARTAGSNLKAQIGPVFAYAMAEEVIDDNPVRRVQSPTKAVARDRVLTDDELREVWRAADNLGKLLILTGARLGEAEKFEAAQLDLDGDAPTWTVPASAAKNAKAHVIALCPRAVELLRDGLPSISRSRWRQAWREQSGVDFVPHDCRRTMASGMAALGIDHHIIERCLNHQPKSMTAVALIYNRHAYAEQMRAAWMRWADHVESVVEGQRSNVVKLF